jgi:hypothetical protein
VGHGRVFVDGTDCGSGFALAPRVVVTAAHVVGRGGLSTTRFMTSAGVMVAVVAVARHGDLDVAVLLLEQDAPTSLAAGVARDGQPWRVDARPLGNDPRLSGVISSARRTVTNAVGREVDVIQLQVEQGLASYEGYSGAAVTLASDPLIVVGVLVEQVLADRGGVGGPGRASKVLYAVPITSVIKAAHLAEVVQMRQSPLTRGAGEGFSTGRDAVMALMQAQVRAADELPYQVFGARRPPLSSVYVRQRLTDIAAPVGPASRGGSCRLEAALARHRHLILIGGPGQGKSTLTLQLVRQLAGGWLTAERGDGEQPEPVGVGLVPLRVTGRQLATRTHLPWLQALAQAATADLGSYLDLDSDLSADLLRGPVADIPWLVVVDGLDEVVEPEQRDKLIANLARRLADTEAPRRLLIASRPLRRGSAAGVHPPVVSGRTGRGRRWRCRPLPARGTKRRPDRRAFRAAAGRYGDDPL